MSLLIQRMLRDYDRQYYAADGSSASVPVTPPDPKGEDASGQGNGDPTNPPAVPPKDAKAEEAANEKKFSQADLDKFIEARLKREREVGERRAEDIRVEAEKAAAEKAGDFEKLYKAEQRKNEQLARDVEKRDDVAIRLRVCSRHGLTAEKWADRLQGSTEAEYILDAKEIAKDLKPATAPKSEGGDQSRKTIVGLDEANLTSVARGPRYSSL